MHKGLRSPRLQKRDHLISTLLIRIIANPTFLLLSTIALYLTYNMKGQNLLVTDLAYFVSVLDLISNAYQEVSADLRHTEVLHKLEKLTHFISKG